MGEGNKNSAPPTITCRTTRGSIAPRAARRVRANPWSVTAPIGQDTRRTVEASKRRLSGWEDAFKGDADLFAQGRTRASSRRWPTSHQGAG
jgi:hypothetical protein